MQNGDAIVSAAEVTVQCICVWVESPTSIFWLRVCVPPGDVPPGPTLRPSLLKECCCLVLRTKTGRDRMSERNTTRQTDKQTDKQNGSTERQTDIFTAGRLNRCDMFIRRRSTLCVGLVHGKRGATWDGSEWVPVCFPHVAELPRRRNNPKWRLDREIGGLASV